MKSEIFLCSCYGEGISVQQYDDNEIDISLWMRGTRPRMGLKDRIRYIWQILTKGYAWADEIVLTDETARQLGQYLIDITNKREGCVELGETETTNEPTFSFSKSCPNCNQLNQMNETLCYGCGEEI